MKMATQNKAVVGVDKAYKLMFSDYPDVVECRHYAKNAGWHWTKKCVRDAKRQRD